MLTETQELKSCPFCGSDVVEINRYDGGWGVNCLTECCMGNVAPDEQRWDERGSAIRSWNTRPSPDAGGVVEVLQEVINWNTKYPSCRIYSESEIRKIAAEMDEINERAKQALSTLTQGNDDE